MRQISRINFILLVTFLSTSVTTSLFGQQSKPGQRQPLPQSAPAGKPPVQNRQAPKTPAAVIEEKLNKEEKAKPKAPVVSKEMQEILEKWELQSSKMKSIHGNQSRSEFSKTFATEKVSRGPFFVEMPDKGRIDMMAVKFKKGEVSQRTAVVDGKKVPYTLETGQPQRYICTGEWIYMLNEDEAEKTFEKREIPEDQRGQNIVHSPLPFLFGMKADEAKSRFKLVFEKDNDGNDKNNNTRAILWAFPKMATDQQNYDKARIDLDKKRYLPTQVRLYSGEDSETVYTFDDVVVNEGDFKGAIKRIFGIEKDPFKPNLKGYAEVITAADPISVRERLEEKIKQTSDRAPAGPVLPKGAQEAKRTNPSGRSSNSKN